VAVFPERYEQYVAQLSARAATVVATGTSDQDASGPSAESAEPAVETTRYRVRRGDSLWELARKYGTTVEDLQTLNGLADQRIVAGATILLPATGR
jgi:LysM repeat protein